MKINRRSRWLAILTTMLMVFSLMPLNAFAAADNTHDVTNPANPRAIVDGVYWELFNPSQGMGTGNMESFLRVQANGTEWGYNTDGKVEGATKTGSWTHAILLKDIPYGAQFSPDGEVLYYGREFLCDLNEVSGKDMLISVDDYQFWMTDDPNINSYPFYDEATDEIAVGYPGDTWTYTGSDGATHTAYWIGEIDYDFTPQGDDLTDHTTGAPLDREFLFDQGISSSGSGAADYRNIIPNEYFLEALDESGLTEETAYIVLVVKFGEKGGFYSSSDGFEEWGVRKSFETGSLQVTKAFDPAQGIPLPESVDITITGPSYPTGNTKTITKDSNPAWTASWLYITPGEYTVTVSNEQPVSNNWTIPGPQTVTVGISTMSELFTKVTVTDYAKLGSLEATLEVKAQDFHNELKQDFHNELKQDFHNELKQDFHNELKQDFHNELKQDFHNELKQDFYDEYVPVFEKHISNAYGTIVSGIT